MAKRDSHTITIRGARARLRARELDELVAAVHGAVSRRADWQQTARLVAGQLRRNLPTPDVLSGEQRIGDPDAYRSHVLHTEPDGTSSIDALVWRPGHPER
jgi:3-mercaptopropionate dioxygenase